MGWATRWQSLGPLARVSHDSTRDLGWLEEDEHGWLSLLLGIRRGSWRVMVDTYLTWLCLRPWPFHPGALHFSICCPNAQQVVWRALVSPVHVHLRMDCRYLRLSSFFTVVNALPIYIYIQSWLRFLLLRPVWPHFLASTSGCVARLSRASASISGTSSAWRRLAPWSTAAGC